MPARIAATGLETPADFSGKTTVPEKDAANSAAFFEGFGWDAALFGPDLAMIVERWPSLPDGVRHAIVAIVEAADRVAR